MSTPNLGLETVPADSFQPSVPVNESLKILDALVQIGVQGVENDPPVTADPADLGKTWRVGDTPTGVFTGHAGDIAMCTGANLWMYFEGGTQVKYLLDFSDGGFYKNDGGGWTLAGGLSDAPSDGVTYGRKDGAWVDTASAIAAEDVSYDNTTSGLTATDAQAAIDEVADELDSVAAVVAAYRTPTVQSIASSATPTPTFSDDTYDLTALAVNAVFAAPTGTAIPNLGMVIRIKDDGTPRTLGWNAIYHVADDVVLPTVTVPGETLYVAMIYNGNATRWDVVAVGNVP